MIISLIYFSGVIVTWIIGILFMKYNKELVINKYDLDQALELLVVASILSWVIVLSFIATAIVYGIKQFIQNKLGDWILKGK